MGAKEEVGLKGLWSSEPWLRLRKTLEQCRADCPYSLEAFSNQDIPGDSKSREKRNMLGSPRRIWRPQLLGFGHSDSPVREVSFSHPAHRVPLGFDPQ